MAKKKTNKELSDREIASNLGKRFSEMLCDLDVGSYVVRPLIKGDKEFSDECTLAVSVGFPYKDIKFSVGKHAIDLVREKRTEELLIVLLHEAFHVKHWRFGEMSIDRHIARKSLDEEEEQLADWFALLLNRYWK